MIKIRRASERGFADHGWLKSHHTFSFADYYDPSQMGFRSLRVINQDEILGGTGFSTHGHRDMEIITFVSKGALQHKDTLGNSTVIKPGEIQRMSAGTGIKHSEFNHLQTNSTHLHQIWILPDKLGYEPSYDQKDFTKKFETTDWVLAVSPYSNDNSVSIHQDVSIYWGRPKKNSIKRFELKSGRAIWVQVISGQVKLGENTLMAGDAASIEAMSSIELHSIEDSELLLFDLK